MADGKRRPVVLCILDGWGWRSDPADNAITAAKAPNYKHLLEGPHALLRTSGEAVGLPPGQMGNSEVGHMNIGAGRVVAQDLPRIDTAIVNGTLAQNAALRNLIAHAKSASGVIHLMGLLSPGGVHSHQDHIAALALVLAHENLTVRVHAFLDGRDTPPRSAVSFIETFDGQAGRAARFATIMGRYYAMDRDKRWDRIEKAYNAIVEGQGPKFEDASGALDASYRAGTSDEFVLPSVIGGFAGVRDGDAMLFANFRADRARELSLALLDPAFDGFPRSRVAKFSAAASLAEYSERLNRVMDVLFPPEKISDSLGEYVSKLGLAQLRIAETEKYAHVTYFLNAGREEPFPGEERILVPSPGVATYDLKPEMSAVAVTDKLEQAIRSGAYDLIVVNYANPDMVGHTGVMTAAVTAVETIDTCLGRISAAVKASGGILVVTADHGNIEMMKDPKTGEPHTAHTTFDVPIIVANAGGPFRLTNGSLSDVAPTVLDLMGRKKPEAMSGHSLIERP